MDRFEALLAPVARQEFLGRYWGKCPILIRNTGTPHKFHDLPGVEHLPQLLSGRLSASGHWVKSPVNVQASVLDADRAVRQLGIVPLSSIEQLYNAGASLCFSSLDAADPTLREMTEAVKQHTAPAGDVCMTCYLSPPKSGGPMHFDSQHVFLCQVAGEKCWTVSMRPAVPAPPLNLIAKTLDHLDTTTALSSIGLEVKRPEDCELIDMVLGPGDLLYLPPGTWHEPRTRDQLSLHYTLTMLPFGFWNLLYAFLRMRLMERPEWRQDLRFADQLDPDSNRTRFLEDRLRELRDDLSGISSEDLLRAFTCTAGDVKHLFRTS